MSGGITFRRNKGTALTHDELDDNFAVVAGEPYVRFFKWYNSDEVVNAIDIDNNVNHNYFRWNGWYSYSLTYFDARPHENTAVQVNKTGVYRLTSRVGFTVSVPDVSTYTDNPRLTLQIIKVGEWDTDGNGDPIIGVPNNAGDVVVAEDILNLDLKKNTMEYSMTCDTLREINSTDEIYALKLKIEEATQPLTVTFKGGKGEFSLEWLGYAP